MGEEVWVINKTEEKLIVGIKEIHFYYKGLLSPNETLMEDVDGKGCERRIIVEIEKSQNGKGGEE